MFQEFTTDGDVFCRNETVQNHLRAKGLSRVADPKLPCPKRRTKVETDPKAFLKELGFPKREFDRLIASQKESRADEVSKTISSQRTLF